jgi:hypothetical protein
LLTELFLHAVCTSSRLPSFSIFSDTAIGGIEVQLVAPNQASLKAHLYNPLEESPEDSEAVALADAGEARMIGRGLAEAREALRGYEASTLADVAATLAKAAESLARTSRELRD